MSLYFIFSATKSDCSLALRASAMRKTSLMLETFLTAFLHLDLRMRNWSNPLTVSLSTWTGSYWVQRRPSTQASHPRCKAPGSSGKWRFSKKRFESRVSTHIWCDGFKRFGALRGGGERGTLLNLTTLLLLILSGILNVKQLSPLWPDWVCCSRIRH